MQGFLPIVLNRRQIGAFGEKQIGILLLDLLGWYARRDDPDEGYDFNVEVPEGEGPAQRFLVQVKTASTQRTDRHGNWPITIKSSIVRRYRQSRHPVFLIAYERSSHSARWLDVSDVLRKNTRTTFALPSGQVLDAEGASAFKTAVEAAFLAADADHVDIGQALAERAQRLMVRNPNLDIRIDHVDGKQIVTLRPIAGKSVKVTTKPKSQTDADRFRKGIEFGGRVEIKLEHIASEDSPILNSSGATLVLDCETCPIRLRLTFGKQRRGLVLEMNASATRGSKGMRIISVEPSWPFGIEILIPGDSRIGHFSPTCFPDCWKGHDLRELPMLDLACDFARSMLRSEPVGIEIYQLGRWQPFIKFTPGRVKGLLEYFRWFSVFARLAHVCRYYRRAPVLWTGQRLTEEQVLDIVQLYRLSRTGRIPHAPGSLTADVSGNSEAMLAKLRDVDASYMFETQF